MNIKTFSISILLILLITVSIRAVSAENNETVLTDTGSDTAFIQNAIDSASDGDTINLGENKEYNLKNDTININKKVTIKGENVTITAGAANGALSIRSMSDVIVDGISFINPVDLPNYGGTISGKAIYTQASSNIKISNCRFINYAYGVEMYSTTNSEVKNSYFNGATTSVSGMSGTGTKAIQLMGSKNINIKNNVFYGQIYDALSIASGSSSTIIENNTFINNTFAIFYGGASTEGNKIRNNRFVTCGVINETYSYNFTVGGKNYAGSASIDLDDLPVIGLQKASSGIEISGNEFTVKNNAMIIYSEAENTAHGFPSVIGGVNINGNTVLKADSNVDPTTVTFYQIKALTSLGLSPTDDITLKNNDFADAPGINRLSLEFGAITDDGNDITIPKSTSKSVTSLNVVYARDGRVVVELTDSDDYTLIGESVTYTVNGGSAQSQTTDSYGHIYITNMDGAVNIKVNYAESDSYAKSSLTSELQLGNTQTATGITASNLNVFVSTAKSTTLKATLKDAAGNVLEGKTVSISFNGKIYTATSDSDGVVSFKLPTSTAGKYQTTLAFTGDSTYKGSVKAVTVTICKQATKLTVAKKTFKKSATKKVAAVLKDSKSKVIKGKKVTMKVNGKTYKATTNAKGVATFTVKLTKKGTFTATTKFAGDSAYTAKTVKSKITVK